MTMKVSKNLGVSVVAMPSAEHMPAKGEDEQEAARTTQWLVMGWVEMAGLGGGLRLHEPSLDQEIAHSHAATSGSSTEIS